MTAKHVLFSFGLLLFSVLVLNGLARAEYFNSDWYRNYLPRGGNVPVFRQESETAPPAAGENAEKPPFVQVRPPKEVPQAIVTSKDSINMDRGVVEHRDEIRGLRLESYYTVPLPDYMQQNRELKLDRIWTKSKSASFQKLTGTTGSGASKLDIVIPVGERFQRLVGGTTNINIDGSQRIEFSGRSEYDEGVIATATNTNNKFPSLTMKQVPQFSIRGNIGDRLQIDIKQDAQAGPLANLADNISIKYNGKPNDILKYIEAGNTSLNLPGATFAGYSGTHQGLFGIRAEAQVGPIALTAIASQEKGESNTRSFRGTAAESSMQIRDYQYKTNTYFFLDNYYRDQFALSRDDFSRILYDPADSVTVIEIYINDSNSANDTNDATLAYPGVAWPMDMVTGAQDSSETTRVEGFFHRMDPSEYYISRELGFIQFNRRIDENWTVGVYIKTKGDPRRGIPAEQFGRLEYDSTRPTETRNVFKLIKRKNQRPTDRDTWDLEWKNVYDLGQTNIDLDGLEIKVYREATDGVSRDKQNGVPYIQILGLDRVDETGNPNSKPDNKVDFNRGLVDPARGELIMPLLRPFDSPLPPAGVDTELAEKVPQIYDSANQSERVEATKYYIDVKTAQRQSTIRIEAGFGGILDNSETVSLNGRKLTRGTDYRINYTSGEVTFLTPDAMSPNADIAIDYQETTAFQPMQKTLFGLRGEYALWSESRLGAVFLFNNESTKEKRVRLGNEPSRTMLFDVDADLNFQPQYLTRAVDRLPGVVANTPSRVRVQAEYAQSMPNMNTHGDVYIDDFEGSQDTPLSIMRTNWYTASRPVAQTTAGSRLKTRGRLQWFNPWDRVDSQEIWPKKETVAGENTVHVLSMAYGKSDSLGIADDESWAGITNAFWGSGVDLSRARFLEIWAKGGKGELKIDLGSISEDYYPLENPNLKLDTEDKPIPGTGQGDGILTEEEDTGLDGKFDRDETGYSETNPDPNRDDFGYNESNKDDYSHINGTEGNAKDSDRMGLPDTEDLNRNGILDTRNNYYEYSINFGDRLDPYLVKDTVPEGKPEGWRLFRIPIWDNRAAVAAGTTDHPDSTLIEFVRLWITGTDSTAIQIAEMKVIESRWLEQGVYDDTDRKVTTGDDVVQVTNKSIQENLDYVSPPGVKGELDRDTKIRQNEQSTVIGVENLSPGNTGFVYRTFERMDFTDYTSLKMNVHGADEFPLAGMPPDGYEFIARFGADKDNYYEYRMPLYRGWATENNMEIDFAACTELKLIKEYGFNTIDYAASLIDSLKQVMPDSLRARAVADSLAQAMAVSLRDSLFIHKDGRTYTIKGSPSLNNVRVIQFGLKNGREFGPITTEIWIDELRMDNLRDMGGSAARVVLDTDLSGFMQVQGRVQQMSDDFHGMNAKKGSGKSSTSWSSNVRINLDRFAPRRWNLSLSISADMLSDEALPRLKSGSDIILPGSQKYQYRDSSLERKTHLTYKKGPDATKKGVIGLVNRWAFEKLSVDYDWGERSIIDPNNGKNNLDNQQLQVRYDVAPREKGFPLFGWMPELPTDIGRYVSNARFNYTPRILNYQYQFNENNTYTTDIDGNIETPLNLKNDQQTLNFAYDPFSSLTYDFQLTSEGDRYLKQEVLYRENSRIGLTGPQVLYLTNKYRYEVLYDENNDPKYSLSSQLGSRTIAFTKSASVNAEFGIDRLLSERLSGRPRPPEQAAAPQNRPTWRSLFGWLFGGKPGQKPAQTPSNAAGQTGAGQRPAAGENPGESNPDQEQGAGGTAESVRTRTVMSLSNMLNPITMEYRKQENLNYAGVSERPGFMSRIGRAEIPSPDSTSIVSSRNTAEISETYNAGTRLELPMDMGVRLDAKFENRERASSSVSERIRKSTFPDVSFTMTRVDDKLVFIKNIKKYVSNLSFNSTFSVDKEKNYQNNSIVPQIDRNIAAFAPLFGLNARFLNLYDVAFALNTSGEESRNYSGDVISVSLTDEVGTISTVKYRITSSQGLPLFKNIRLKSDIDLTAEYRTKSTQTDRSVGNETGALIRDDAESSFSLNGNYSFSTNIRGGASMMFSKNKNITKRIHKVREVSVWCELRF